MQRRFFTAITAALLLLWHTAADGARDSLNILTIGNSFANDSTAYLVAAGASAGKTIDLYGLNLGGHSLAQHAAYLRAYRLDPTDPTGSPYKAKTGVKRISLPEALRSAQWDVVTVQQVSRQSFKPESYEPFGGELILCVKEHAPNAKIWVHETWQYRDDQPFLAKERITPDEMYQSLHQAYADFAARYGLEIIRVGTAFNKAIAEGGWKHLPDPEFDFANPPLKRVPAEKKGLHRGWIWSINRSTKEPRFFLDGYHANIAGRYLGATVFLFTLFPDVEDHRFVPPELTPEEAADLRKIARSVVSTGAIDHSDSRALGAAIKRP